MAGLGGQVVIGASSPLASITINPSLVSEAGSVTIGHASRAEVVTSVRVGIGRNSNAPGAVVLEASGRDDTEGALTFYPSGFTVTANPLSNPPPGVISDPIATQTAGTNFALHLAAYGTTATDPVCGVIESYTGSKTLDFWMSYSDPSVGVRVATVGGAAVGASEAGAAPIGVTTGVRGRPQATASRTASSPITTDAEVQPKQIAASGSPGASSPATSPSRGAMARRFAGVVGLA